MSKQSDVMLYDAYLMRHRPASKIVIAIANFSVRWGDVICLCYPMRITCDVSIFLKDVFQSYGLMRMNHRDVSGIFKNVLVIILFDMCWSWVNPGAHAGAGQPASSWVTAPSHCPQDPCWAPCWAIIVKMRYSSCQEWLSTDFRNDPVNSRMV